MSFDCPFNFPLKGLSLIEELGKAYRVECSTSAVARWAEESEKKGAKKTRRLGELESCKGLLTGSDDGTNDAV